MPARGLWYKIPLGVLLFPFAVVAASPVILLVAVVATFRAIYPDRVMQVGDPDGTPRRRAALARWRQRYAGLGFGQRLVRSYRVWERERKARRTRSCSRPGPHVAFSRCQAH